MQGKINCESINGHLNSGQLNGQLSIDDLNIEIDQPVLNASLLQTSGLTGTINPGQGSGGHGREYHAGQGINITGSTINANVDGQTIIVNENNQLVANVEGDCNLITYDLDEYLALTTDERKVVFQEWVNILDDHDKQLRLHTSNINAPYLYAEKYTTFEPNGITIEFYTRTKLMPDMSSCYVLGAHLIAQNNGWVSNIYSDTNTLQYKLVAGNNISITRATGTAYTADIISATVPDSNICLIDIADIRADGVTSYNTFLTALQANKTCLIGYGTRNNNWFTNGTIYILNQYDPNTGKLVFNKVPKVTSNAPSDYTYYSINADSLWLMSDGTLVSDALIANVQRKLRAGTNISITSDNYGPIISAKGLIYGGNMWNVHTITEELYEGIKANPELYYFDFHASNDNDNTIYKYAGTRASSSYVDGMYFVYIPEQLQVSSRSNTWQYSVGNYMLYFYKAIVSDETIYGVAWSSWSLPSSPKLYASTGIILTDHNPNTSHSEVDISVNTSVIQPKLTAGQNITIDANNVISASGDSVYGIIHYDPNNEPTFNSVKAIIDSGRIPVIIYDPADSNYPDTTNYQPLTEHSGIYNFAGCSSTGGTKYIDFIKSVYLPFPIDPQTGSTRLLHIGLFVDENDNWTFDANVKTD